MKIKLILLVCDCISVDGNKQREEVRGDTGGDHQTNLTLQEADEGTLKP